MKCVQIKKKKPSRIEIHVVFNNEYLPTYAHREDTLFLS